MGCGSSKPANVEAPTPQSPGGGTRSPTAPAKEQAVDTPSKAKDSAPSIRNGSAAPSKPVSDASTSSSHSVNGNAGAISPKNWGMPPIPDDGSAGSGSWRSSGASNPGDDTSIGSGSGSRKSITTANGNPKTLLQSNSVLGLDKMIEDRKGEGDLKSNVVHIEVPFGKPIEDLYNGVHDGPVLGSGISGLVRLITHKSTGVKYAVKCLDLGLVETEEGLQQLREEIYIMCQLDHPNIVRLEEVYESFSEIYLVQELCVGGELFDRLDEQPEYHYTEGECARLVKQMLCAVRYIHSKGIIHRDLKLENFLFSSTERGSELKMIDFGLSKHFKFGEVQHEAVGTPYTVAPEVIRGCYDERCDVWAIGVITFLLLSGDPPFGGCGGPEPLMTVRENILRGHFEYDPEDVWENVSPQAKEFITKLLVTDPNRRPTARETQRSLWLKEWANKDRKADDHVLNPNVVKALVNFKEYSDMRKLLCEVLSFTLLPDQITDLRQEFEKLDTDGSGEISLAGLKQVLISNAGTGSLGALTEEEVEDIFNAMRVRKTETRIHWHEFIAAGLSQCKVDDRNLKLAFDRLDADHKGFITFENVTDLLGHDPSHSEDAMRRMWGDSMIAVSSKDARITYEDFLLLMKGQTKQDDTGSSSTSLMMDHRLDRMASNSSLGGVGMGLGVLHETHESHLSDEDHVGPAPSHIENIIVLPSGDVVVKSSGIITESGPTGIARKGSGTLQESDEGRRASGSRRLSNDSVSFLPSIPDTPHAPGEGEVAFDEMEGPLIMVDDDDIDERISEAADKTMLGLTTGANTANLTPPQSPRRGAVDYITPVSQRDKLSPVSLEGAPILPDGLSTSEGGLPSLNRRRSRSVDLQTELESGAGRANSSGGGEPGDQSPLFVQDVRRAMLLPEHSHDEPEIEQAIKDETVTPLVVNRKLYRAHRQMRLAVMEASKRFEEEQIARTKKMLEKRGGQPCGAGLTMRRGHAPQMSLEEIREVIKKQQKQQDTAVNKANKRGGRGRRTRKKTVSDMAGMLGSVPPAEIIMGPTPAAEKIPETIPETRSAKRVESDVATQPVEPLRQATTPGVFRNTVDPFAEFTGYRKMVGLEGPKGSKSAKSLGNEPFASAFQRAEVKSSAKPLKSKNGDEMLTDASMPSIRSTASDGNLKNLDVEEPSPMSPPGDISKGGEGMWPPPPPL
uniref:Calmodulin n=1 Tax=Odontella aurita TaxID=265563 RepID=A0A7S4IQK3_9STRA|mmetsp:Transcript_28813/g.85013  ORF Transcript_28813/g.85013 Transcript_28813/m.85013 type:complete len:1189 (+) Transcript_28813:322-3888(+)|eukprot:CAMPEP_0113572552 /NCGR_PEP_ID=MMETSP0015_2-20120614/26150_1 /TAXON_ID=2838 /ORGANISM="Odontella" /LENGTH=1188 /DNA_ID=CAMNT_0000475581 /DNA_START=221 /DNA_END=3787 /DNA_ORIENTATION=- /assembly_acc=CAM_ASM_000160